MRLRTVVLALTVLLIGGATCYAGFDDQTSLTLTLPETSLIVQDIPTHNDNAAVAHLRAELEQIFANLKHDYIENAVDNYRQFLSQPAPTPLINSQVFTWECRVAYRDGEVIGCTGDPLDCTCVLVVGKRVFGKAGQIGPY